MSKYLAKPPVNQVEEGRPRSRGSEATLGALLAIGISMLGHFVIGSDRSPNSAMSPKLQSTSPLLDQRMQDVAMQQAVKRATEDFFRNRHQ
jgi:hypothetical protein